MDDRALVYRGADQPDMSVINPESDVWQHIKVSASWHYIFELHPEAQQDSSKLFGDKLADTIFLLEW
jgi:hypothetical protein